MSPSAAEAGGNTQAFLTNASSKAPAENGKVVANGEEPALDVGIVLNAQVAEPWTVEKVLETIPSSTPAGSTSSPLAYFHLLERLKTTKREGWKRFGIQRGESIADHQYRMAMLSYLAPPTLRDRVDLNKCLKMCLIHDMAESLVGDITPVDGVTKPEKSRREATTMDYITKGLLGKVDGGAVGEEIRAIWQEYEDSKTLESVYVHDIDKMELLLQMVEYEKRGEGKLDLGEFAYVRTRIVLDEVKAWAAEVMKEREAFWDGQAHVHGDDGVNGGVAPEKVSMQAAYYANGPQPSKE